MAHLNWQQPFKIKNEEDKAGPAATSSKPGPASSKPGPASSKPGPASSKPGPLSSKTKTTTPNVVPTKPVEGPPPPKKIKSEDAERDLEIDGAVIERESRNSTSEMDRKLRTCVEMISKAIQFINSEDSGLYIRRSYYHMKMNELEKSEEDARKAHELQSDSPATIGQLVTVLYAKKKYPAGDELLTKLPKTLEQNTRAKDQLLQIAKHLRKNVLINEFAIPEAIIERYRLSDYTIAQANVKYFDTL